MFLPTALFEKAEDAVSTTALRALLTIFRDTRGPLDHKRGGSDSEAAQTAHRRWARLSTSALAQRTGRSETAVKRAAEVLEGTWIDCAR